VLAIFHLKNKETEREQKVNYNNEILSYCPEPQYLGVTLEKNFSQRQTLLSPVTVEAIEMIKSSIKIINCELFSNAYFATPPMPCSCVYLDSFSKLGFRA